MEELVIILNDFVNSKINTLIVNNNGTTGLTDSYLIKLGFRKTGGFLLIDKKDAENILNNTALNIIKDYFKYDSKRAVK